MLDYMTCHCCGRGFPATENQDPDPEGDRGLCKPCGGDPEAPAPTVGDSQRTRKAKTRKRNGWGLSAMLEARIPVVAGALSPENRAKFEACDYEKKLRIVEQMMRRGLIF